MKNIFLKSLTSRLSEYSSSEFKVLESDKKSSNYTIIKSKIIPTDGSPEIKIDWRVYTKNPEKPLIRDLIVEGLSLARTQKEEFASILSSNNNDISILINKLEEFVKIRVYDFWWARQDSNLGPIHYECTALTN